MSDTSFTNPKSTLRYPSLSALCRVERCNFSAIQFWSVSFVAASVMVVNTFLYEFQDSESLKKGEADISLEIVPRNHPLIKMTELREEGGSMLETLLTLIASHTISRLVNWCCHSHGLFTPTNQNISLNLIKLFVINRKRRNKSKINVNLLLFVSSQCQPDGCSWILVCYCSSKTCLYGNCRPSI